MNMFTRGTALFALLKRNLLNRKLHTKRSLQADEGSKPGMEKLPAEVMEKILANLEQHIPSMKSLRLVSRGCRDYVTPFLFRTVTIFQHPASEARVHTLSKHSLLAGYVKTIRVPSLISIEKLEASNKDDKNALSHNACDHEFDDCGLETPAAGSTAAYKYKRTCIGRSRKGEGDNDGDELVASVYDMPPCPVRGIPLDLSLFPCLVSIEIVEPDERWHRLAEISCGFDDAGVRPFTWFYGVYGREIIQRQHIYQRMGIAMTAIGSIVFLIDSLELYRYWELLYHQTYPVLDFDGLTKLTLDLTGPEGDRELLDGCDWKLTPALCNLSSLKTLEIFQSPSMRSQDTLYDVVALFQDVHWPRLSRLHLNHIFTRSANLADFLRKHEETLEAVAIVNPMIQPHLWNYLRSALLTGLNVSDFIRRLEERAMEESVLVERMRWYRRQGVDSVGELIERSRRLLL